MHERIRFIEHRGKKILVVDFSNCPAQKVEEIARTVPDYATAKPLNSVLVLTDFAGATFNQDALRALKEAAVFDKPFIKRSALLGTQSFPGFLRGNNQLLAPGSTYFRYPRRSFDLVGGRFGEP